MVLALPTGDSAAFDDAFDEALHEFGRVNVAIFGMSGAGKSTLVNAVFGVDVAQTGIGKPVTRGVHKHVNDSGTLAVFDCEGFELGTAKPALKWLREQVKASRRPHSRAGRREQSSDQFHVAWYCLNARTLRIDDGQEQLLRQLAELELPTILVLTQVPKRAGLIAPDVQEFIDSLRALELPVQAIIATASLDDRFAGTEAHGLEDLARATWDVVPLLQQQAFAAAQKVDLRTKLRYARSWITGAAAFAGGVGAAPIPVADALVLVPAQFQLMGKIAAIYDLPRAKARSVAGGVTGIAAAGGKQAAASLVKLVPGVGSVISAGVAGAITAAVGESWRAVSERVFTGKTDLEDVDVLQQLFRDGLKKGGSRAPAE
jgi:uncharacterized protein (DUF697 family)